VPRNPRIHVDPDASTPANRQIVDQLRALLVDGVVRPGDVLPSVRRLGIDLGVHFNTVADAYRTLASEGWLAVAHGRGARVLDRRSPPAADDMRRAFEQRLRELAAEARAQGVSPAQIARALAELAAGLRSR
jgi:GntR family transcriptional regulator